jgi:enoyl-CoA hydratase/carnithine racemase
MYVSVQKQSSMLVWSIDRPERLNALGPTIGQELHSLAEALEQELASFKEGSSEQDPPYRALLLRARPVRNERRPTIWIAGGDLQELQLLEQKNEGRAYSLQWSRIIDILQDLPIPVIAAIQGAAIGGGAELALAADLRFATEDSSLHFKQLEVGLATGYGSCQRLVQLTGLSRATELLFRCQQISATKARDYGLIHETTVDDAALETLLHEFEQNLKRLSAKGLKVQKKMLTGPWREQKTAWLEQELDLFSSLWMDGAHRQFLETFRTKTKR